MMEGSVWCNVTIQVVQLDEDILSQLIDMSVDWDREECCPTGVVQGGAEPYWLTAMSLALTMWLRRSILETYSGEVERQKIT